MCTTPSEVHEIGSDFIDFSLRSKTSSTSSVSNSGRFHQRRILFFSYEKLSHIVLGLRDCIVGVTGPMLGFHDLNTPFLSVHGLYTRLFVWW